MKIKTSDQIARGINECNTRRTERAEAAASFVVALVVGLLGAMALIHFATPCVQGLC